MHDATYLEGLQKFCASGGRALDPDTRVSGGSWETALNAAGAGLVAIETLDRGDAAAALVLARPPGHHALPDRGMGFCLFNNIAVAAAHLARRGERVLIVDWDVHHGNGTQEAFWNDDRVLFVSMHQYPHYPGTGAACETGGPDAPGLTINVPLPAGSSGDVYRTAFETLVGPTAAEFEPTWVLVSAGFDAHRDDPLADILLTAGDFADMTRLVRDLSPADGRLLLFLEGGYNLDALRKSVGATASVLCEGSFAPERASSGGPDDDAGRAAVRSAIEARRIVTS